MRTFLFTVLLVLFSAQLDARSGGVSLEDAVNQAKSEGRVLSAKTINGKHEIKVLTASGTVKIINKKAANSQAQNNSNRPKYYNKGGQSMRDRKQNPAIPSRFNNQKNNNRLGSRQLDLQPMTLQNKNKNNKNNNKTNNKKDK